MDNWRSGPAKTGFQIPKHDAIRTFVSGHPNTINPCHKAAIDTSDPGQGSLSLLAWWLREGNSGVMSTPTITRPDAALASRLNWLRAGVLGANDGIVSTASLVFGVAGATSDSVALFIAGIAGLLAGALSMGGGEYVSVSTQRDTEQAALAPVRTNPWHAAFASMTAFTAGALIPLLAIVFAPVAVRLAITIVAVLVALAITGYTSARLSGSRPLRPVVRNVLVGSLAMGITFAAGSLVGAHL